MTMPPVSAVIVVIIAPIIISVISASLAILLPAPVHSVIAPEIATVLLMHISVVAIVLYVISVPHVRSGLIYHNFIR